MEPPDPIQEQRKEQDSRLSEILHESEGTVAQPSISPEPPLDTTQQNALLVEPFRPVLEVLAGLERDDPKLAFQASRLISILRSLWESCTAKQNECEKSFETNQRLKQAGAHLNNERNSLQARRDQQTARLDLITQTLIASQDQMTGMLNQWNQIPRSNLADLVDVNCSE